MFRAAAVMTVSYIATGIAVFGLMVALGLASMVLGAAALLVPRRRAA